MNAIVELLHTLLEWIRNPGSAIESYGMVGMALIIFCETGVMIPFLPGDSLLVVAGTYAAKGDFNLLLLNAVLIPCAILGDATSYFIGTKLGPALFNKPKSRFFKPENMQLAQAFYQKHGGKAIIIARFMPIVRTFVPVVAGIGKMPYRRFAAYNMVGGAAWVISMTFLGYFLGQLFKEVFHVDIAKRIEVVIIVVVFLSVLPGVIAWWRGRSQKAPPTPAQPAA